MINSGVVVASSVTVYYPQTRALEEAERIGKVYYDDSADVETADLTWDGRPAYWVFAGVRKLIEITETAATIMEQPQPWDRPGHGTEITYSEMVVDTAEALSKLVNGTIAKWSSTTATGASGIRTATVQILTRRKTKSTRGAVDRPTPNQL